MDLETVILSTASQKKTYMKLLTCGILKNYTNELTYKTEIDSKTENKLTVTKGDRSGGRDRLGVCNTYIGEGHSNPLQYSCPENSMDREGWSVIVHEVAKSQTQLKNQQQHHIHTYILLHIK